MSDLAGNGEIDGNLLAPIIGEYLSAVTFVMDYVQLDFNGACLTALTLPTVRVFDRVWSDADPEWRNRLCDRIGVIARSVDIRDGDRVSVDFEDDSRIEISLRASDYRGPEAINFNAPGQHFVVL